MGRLFDFDFSRHLFLSLKFFIRDRRKTVELSALLIEKRFKGLKKTFLPRIDGIVKK